MSLLVYHSTLPECPTRETPRVYHHYWRHCRVSPIPSLAQVGILVEDEGQVQGHGPALQQVQETAGGQRQVQGRA